MYKYIPGLVLRLFALRLFALIPLASLNYFLIFSHSFSVSRPLFGCIVLRWPLNENIIFDLRPFKFTTAFSGTKLRRKDRRCVYICNQSLTIISSTLRLRLIFPKWKLENQNCIPVTSIYKVTYISEL